MTDINKEAIAGLLKDSNNREALAEFLQEFIPAGHITLDYISLLLNARALKPGDALVKKIRKGIKVHTLVPGSIHLASEVTVKDRINYSLDGIDVKVVFNKWELDKGEIGTVEEIRAEMQAKIRDHLFKRVLTALATVWTAGNTPSNYATIATAVSSAGLKNMIDQINQYGGGAKTIIGTRKAVTPITEFAAFWADPATSTTGVSQSVLDEFLKTGKVGQYMGVPIIAVDQVFDNPEDNNALIPDNYVLVVGNKVGDFITYGDPQWKVWDYNDPTPPYTYIETYQQFGMIIDNALGLGVIQIT
jgi:hypothetical protein